MSRARAQKDPFWAVALVRMAANVAVIVTRLWAVIKASPELRDHIWLGSGWRTGSAEHSSGRAIDIMITARTGQRPTTAELRAGNLLVDWLIRNADRLGIHGIIFSRDGRNRPELWGYSTPGRWRAGVNRGSISGNHVDHIHVYFRAGARWPATLNNTTIGTTPVDARTPLERLLDTMNKDELTELVRAAVRAERGTLAEAASKTMLTDREWRLYGGGSDDLSTLPNAVFLTERSARQALAIIQDLAKRSGVDIDEQALAQSIAASIAPTLKRAVQQAVEAGGSPETIADAVVTRMGAALIEG